MWLALCRDGRRGAPGGLGDPMVDGRMGLIALAAAAAACAMVSFAHAQTPTAPTAPAASPIATAPPPRSFVYAPRGWKIEESRISDRVSFASLIPDKPTPEAEAVTIVLQAEKLDIGRTSADFGAQLAADCATAAMSDIAHTSPTGSPCVLTQLSCTGSKARPSDTSTTHTTFAILGTDTGTVIVERSWQPIAAAAPDDTATTKKNASLIEFFERLAFCDGTRPDRPCGLASDRLEVDIGGR